MGGVIQMLPTKFLSYLSYGYIRTPYGLNFHCYRTRELNYLLDQPIFVDFPPQINMQPHHDIVYYMPSFSVDLNQSGHELLIHGYKKLK